MLKIKLFFISLFGLFIFYFVNTSILFAIESKNIQSESAVIKPDPKNLININKIRTLFRERIIKALNPHIKESEYQIEIKQVQPNNLNNKIVREKPINYVEVKIIFDRSLTKKQSEILTKVIRQQKFIAKNITTNVIIQYQDLKVARVPSLPNKQTIKEPVISPVKNIKNLENESPKLAEKPTPITDIKKSSVLPKTVAKPIVQPQPERNWYDDFMELDILLFFAGMTLFLGLVVYFIKKTKNRRKISEEVLKVDDLDSTINVDTANEESIVPLQEAYNEEVINEEVKIFKEYDGLVKFRKMMIMDFSLIVSLVKTWITVGAGTENLALKALVVSLEDSELEILFKAISFNERKAWKESLDTDLSIEEMEFALNFIGDQILEAKLIPSLIGDVKVCERLLEFSPRDVYRFCHEEPDLRGVIVCVLTAKSVSDLFAIMPTSLTADTIEKSSNLIKSDILAKIPDLKEKILKVSINGNSPPFLRKIIDLLPSANIEVEKHLYSILLKYSLWEEVIKIAINSLPVAIINQLPSQLFVKVVESMSFEEKIKYFTLINDVNKRTLELDKFAIKGNQIREELETGINQILKNDIALKRLNLEMSKMEVNIFTATARNYLKSNLQAQLQIRSLLETWLIKVKEEENPIGRADSLSLVKDVA
jgi:hypothetical protein